MNNNLDGIINAGKEDVILSNQCKFVNRQNKQKHTRLKRRNPISHNKYKCAIPCYPTKVDLITCE